MPAPPADKPVTSPELLTLAQGLLLQVPPGVEFDIDKVAPIHTDVEGVKMGATTGGKQETIFAK
jgi:hypothetical protein